MNDAKYRAAEDRLWRSVGVATTDRMLPLRRLDTTVRIQEEARPAADPGGAGSAAEPVVVFVHGGSASGANWAPMMPHLHGLRWVLLDRPGCGLSPPLAGDRSAADRYAAYADTLLVDVVDALGVERAHVVATSLGGYFALRGAAAHPACVGRMVLFGYTMGAPLAKVPISMRMATVPGVRRLMTSIPPSRGAVRAIFRQLGHRPALHDGRITEEAIEWFVALLRHTPTMRNEMNTPREFVRVGPGSGAPLPAGLLAGLRCPIRFVWGSTDPIGGAEVAEPFVAGIPSAELELWPEVGHAPWLDAPARAAERVVDFLAV